MRSSSDSLIARVALPLAALLAILLVSATPLQAQASRELKLHQLDGRPFSLESLKGSVVVLDFWATWCVPCRSSFPFFDRLQQEYGAKGLKVVGLTLEEDGDAVTDFLEGVPAGFTIARDPTGHAGESTRSSPADDRPLDRSGRSSRESTAAASPSTTSSSPPWHGAPRPTAAARNGSPRVAKTRGDRRDQGLAARLPRGPDHEPDGDASRADLPRAHPREQGSRRGKRRPAGGGCGCN